VRFTDSQKAHDSQTEYRHFPVFGSGKSDQRQPLEAGDGNRHQKRLALGAFYWLPHLGPEVRCCQRVYRASRRTKTREAADSPDFRLSYTHPRGWPRHWVQGGCPIHWLRRLGIADMVWGTRPQRGLPPCCASRLLACLLCPACGMRQKDQQHANSENTPRPPFLTRFFPIVVLQLCPGRSQTFAGSPRAPLTIRQTPVGNWAIMFCGVPGFVRTASSD
jgi:hypothetical protein